MHPNPVFQDGDPARNFDFAAERGFGVLAVNGEDGPMMAHVPFILAPDRSYAELHLVRSNPIARALGSRLRAKIAVSGPDSYVSPDWYGVADQVPTWNYVAVHLTGTLEQQPQDSLPDLLARQSAEYEARLLPKPPWHLSKMTPDVLDKLLRMIVPCRMQIAQVEGTWKLGQNKPEAARQSAAEQMRAYGQGHHFADLAALMQGWRDDRA